jgi:hypothetical protein
VRLCAGFCVLFLLSVMVLVQFLCFCPLVVFVSSKLVFFFLFWEGNGWQAFSIPPCGSEMWFLCV